MNTIWTLARKDLLLLMRDKLALFWMLLFPFVFAVFFGSIFGGTGAGAARRIQVAVVADDLDPAREAFLARLAERPIDLHRVSRQEAADEVRRGTASAYLDLTRIPSDAFAMFRGEQPEIEIGIDPSRFAERAMLEGFVVEASFGALRKVFTDRDAGQHAAHDALESVKKSTDLPAAQRLVLTTFLGSLEKFLGTVDLGADSNTNGNPMSGPKITAVDVTRRRDFPPNAFEISFPQAILWGLLGCAAAFAQTFVRERSQGTLVRLWTAPIARGAVLAGKLVACAVTALFVIAVLFGAGALVFGVGIAAPLTLVLGVLASAFCFGGVAVFLATIGRTEQANAGISWGALCLLSMVGGGMVPQVFMPDWMLQIGAISPTRWAIRALEGGIWRGLPMAEIAVPLAMLIGLGLLGLFAGFARARRVA